MDSKTIEAQKIFGETFANTLSKFSAVFTFWQISRLGVPNAQESLTTQIAEFITDLFIDPKHVNFFTDQSKAIEILKDSGGIEGYASQLAQKQISNYLFTADSASIVFGQ